MKQFKVIAPIVAAVVLVGAALVITTSNNQTPVRHVKQIDLDHKTYTSVKELKNESDVVVRGTVQDNGRTVASPSLRSEDGTEVPSPPTTEFAVQVTKIFKGAVSGNEIIVVLTGGVAGDTRYEAQDMPWLSKQKNVILYLHLGDDGKYYPMAGGAAIASKKSDSSNLFTLPVELSGDKPIDITEAEL